MKTIVLLLPLLALACTSFALPEQLQEESSLDEAQMVHPLFPQLRKEPIADETVELARERRSPSGWQPGRGAGNTPQSQPQQSRGSISGGVHRERGVGTIAHVQGQGNIWTSKNGQGRLDAQGQWSKVVRGPARSKPNYNVGLTYSHRF